MLPNSNVQMIAEYDGDVTDLFNTKADGIIPILATRNMVLFPGVMNPILIGRARSLSLIKKVEKEAQQHIRHILPEGP